MRATAAASVAMRSKKSTTIEFTMRIDFDDSVSFALLDAFSTLAMYDAYERFGLRFDFFAATRFVDLAAALAILKWREEWETLHAAALRNDNG